MKTRLFYAALLLWLFIAFNNNNSTAQVNYAGTTTNGVTPSAIGTSTIATGNYSFAAGYMSEATNHTAIALGWQTKASGPQSVSIGQSSYSDNQSYSFGQNAIAAGQQSVAIGRFVKTDAVFGFGSMVIGSSISNKELVNNIGNSLMIGFQSTKPTFFIGPAPTFDGIGRVGIGTTTPQTTLHVAGDVTINTLANPAGTMLVAADKSGKLFLTSGGGNGGGDNLGDHIARQDLMLGDFSILGPGGKESIVSPKGETWLQGLKFNGKSSGEMRLASFADATFELCSYLPDEVSANTMFWVTSSNSGGIGFGLNSDKTAGIFWDRNRPQKIMSFYGTKVGIATDPVRDSPYNLFVDGGILTTEVKVMLKDEWKDFVFLPSYKLRPLQEVELFISRNGHLPEIPSAAEVKKNGIELGEMNALLLQKIEELTLYVIELEKKYQNLDAQVNPESQR